jgi:hypothetical protein
MGTEGFQKLAYMVPLMLIGCATPATVPEMAINKPPETVQSCVTQGMIARGWRVRSDNPGKVIFSKLVGPTPGGNTSYGSVATLSFHPGKVITDVKMVTDIDTAIEQPFANYQPDTTDVDSAVALCR